VSSWEDALDAIERRLDGAGPATALDEARVPFEPPPVSGPLPTELRERATALLDRTNGLQTELEAELARIQSELRRAARPATAERVGGGVDIGA
jgi:hypothetical protein